MSKNAELLKTLGRVAAEIRQNQIAGWGNAVDDAAQAMRDLEKGWDECESERAKLDHHATEQQGVITDLQAVVDKADDLIEGLYSSGLLDIEREELVRDYLGIEHNTGAEL